MHRALLLEAIGHSADDAMSSKLALVTDVADVNALCEEEARRQQERCRSDCSEAVAASERACLLSRLHPFLSADSDEARRALMLRRRPRCSALPVHTFWRSSFEAAAGVPMLHRLAARVDRFDAHPGSQQAANGTNGDYSVKMDCLHSSWKAGVTSTANWLRSKKLWPNKAENPYI